MGFYLHDVELLGLSNHKCGSTTVMDVIKGLFQPTVIGVGQGVNFLQHQRPNHPPWKHANLRAWYRYLEINGYPGVRPYVFTTTRNPWDRMVSLYTYDGWHSRTYSEERRLDFNAFLSRLHEARGYAFVNYIRDFRIDRVLRLESLDTELRDLLRDVAGIELEDAPPRRNASVRGDYRDYYSDRSIELVWQMFAWEIEAFGYDF